MYVARLDCSSRSYLRSILWGVLASTVIVIIGFFLPPEIAGFAWIVGLGAAIFSGYRTILSLRGEVWELAISADEVRWGLVGIAEQRIPTKAIAHVAFYRDAESGSRMVAELRDGSAREIEYLGIAEPTEIIHAFENMCVPVTVRD